MWCRFILGFLQERLFSSSVQFSRHLSSDFEALTPTKLDQYSRTLSNLDITKSSLQKSQMSHSHLAGQLVVYFICGHKETTIINTERSTQKNRNFWCRVKTFASSTPPPSTMYQQSASLCTRCCEVEQKQITEAAEIQAKMAENAARVHQYQGKQRFAPPPEGLNEALAAMEASPSGNNSGISEKIRHAHLSTWRPPDRQAPWQAPGMRTRAAVEPTMSSTTATAQENAPKVKPATALSSKELKKFRELSHMKEVEEAFLKAARRTAPIPILVPNLTSKRHLFEGSFRK
jgi:hypothetical protein